MFVTWLSCQHDELTDYSLGLFLLQLACLARAVCLRVPSHDAIADASGHIMLFHALHAVSTIFYVYSYFGWAEAILVLNYANMSIFHFRHRHHHHPYFIQLPMISGPLAWTYFALFWNGACLVTQPTNANQAAGSNPLWWILCYGIIYASAFKVSRRTLSCRSAVVL